MLDEAKNEIVGSVLCAFCPHCPGSMYAKTDGASRRKTIHCINLWQFCQKRRGYPLGYPLLLRIWDSNHLYATVPRTVAGRVGPRHSRGKKHAGSMFFARGRIPAYFTPSFQQSTWNNTRNRILFQFFHYRVSFPIFLSSLSSLRQYFFRIPAMMGSHRQDAAAVLLLWHRPPPDCSIDPESSPPPSPAAHPLIHPTDVGFPLPPHRR